MRSRTTFDWRWIVVIFIALLFFGQIRIAPSPLLSMVLLALGGYWAVQAGIEPWRGRRSLLGSSKVTYWRGQRIETRTPVRARFRTPPTTPLIVSIIYLLMGLGLWFSALLVLLRLVTLAR